MKINAINSVNYTNFTGKKNNLKKAAQNAAAAGMVLVPIAAQTTSCEPIKVSAYAGVGVKIIPVCPGGTIRDTVYIPSTFKYPYQIMDSLNHYRGDIIDIEADGDDGDYSNKALLYASGKRNWNYDTPEYIKLNLEKCDTDEARYDHVIADSLKNDIRITLVNKGDITVVKEDGTVTDEVSGLLVNEDGVKTFIHSNGKDRILVYPKATSGEYNGKFVYLGSVEPGYLPEEQYGQNVLLYSILSPGTEDHYIDVEALVKDIDELKEESSTEY